MLLQLEPVWSKILSFHAEKSGSLHLAAVRTSPVRKSHGPVDLSKPAGPSPGVLRELGQDPFEAEEDATFVRRSIGDPFFLVFRGRTRYFEGSMFEKGNTLHAYIYIYTP